MSRKSYNMQWCERDHEELQRVINNFNQKLYRVKKRNPDIAEYQPERMTKAKAMEKIGTRADFNRLINSLKRYSKRGAENPRKSSRGAKATDWEVREFNRAQGIENARRTKARKAILGKEVTIGRQGTGFTRAEMGRIRENSLKPDNSKFKSKSQKEWEWAQRRLDATLNSVKRKEKQEKMRQNYLMGLLNNGFLDANPELETWIMGIDIDTFTENVVLDEFASFLWYKDRQAFDDRLWGLEETWGKLYREKNGDK